MHACSGGRAVAVGNLTAWRELGATAEVSIVDLARKRLDPTQRRCRLRSCLGPCERPNQPNAVTRCNESLLAPLGLVVEYARVGLMGQHVVVLHKAADEDVADDQRAIGRAKPSIEGSLSFTVS